MHSGAELWLFHRYLKQLQSPSDRTYTLCRDPCYASPEMLQGQGKVEMLRMMQHSLKQVWSSVFEPLLQSKPLWCEITVGVVRQLNECFVLQGTHARQITGA